MDCTLKSQINKKTQVRVALFHEAVQGGQPTIRVVEMVRCCRKYRKEEKRTKNQGGFY
uniref:Uncharacterized protein n=1 Tax=Nelumbo nucifera TaxID=4432 RepID=A0A822YBJ1_NELNU|nr:TPA_asm: hypothetical protein HUJ06_031418 [Nelumbo nucifera]